MHLVLAKAYRHCLVHSDPTQMPHLVRYLMGAVSWCRVYNMYCCRSVRKEVGSGMLIGPYVLQDLLLTQNVAIWMPYTGYASC